MTKTVILSGETIEKNGKYYFMNVDSVINEFLEQHNAEYVDLKVLDTKTCEVILIYKEKENK